jgi:hypothetical protein
MHFRTIFFLTPSRKLIFCLVLLYLGIALFDDVFDAKYLINTSSVLGVKVPVGINCLPLCWK